MRLSVFKALMLIAFLIGIAFHSSAQSTNVSLIVTTTDGEELTYQLSENSQLYFENGEKVIIVDNVGITTALDLSRIRKIVCTETTGIPENDASQLQIAPNPSHDRFIIQNLTGTSIARIYTLDGRLVKVFQASEGMSVDITDLMRGMYLLNIDGKTLKLMKL
ncbi:MAG: T9SS type A sorting domain-containing protein [Bacteroidales bacterium]|nr:T9SS type A sorting domain-containing protein [Bacteroidales bacterium]